MRLRTAAGTRRDRQRAYVGLEGMHRRIQPASGVAWGGVCLYTQAVLWKGRKLPMSGGGVRQ